MGNTSSLDHSCSFVVAREAFLEEVDCPDPVVGLLHPDAFAGERAAQVLEFAIDVEGPGG
jgi:hypothetical protein